MYLNLHRRKILFFCVCVALLNLHRTWSLSASLSDCQSLSFWDKHPKRAPLSSGVTWKACVFLCEMGSGPKLFPFLVKLKEVTGLPDSDVQLKSILWPDLKTATPSFRLTGSLSTRTLKAGWAGVPDFERNFWLIINNITEFVIYNLYIDFKLVNPFYALDNS